MPILCVLLYLPAVIERSFHAEEPWMAQSAGGPHNSFQPIIQMGIAIQTRSLQVPLLSPWDGFTGWASPGIYLTLQRAAKLFFCCLSSAAWKRTSFPENNTAAERIRCYHGGNDGRVARAEQAEGTGLSVPVAPTHPCPFKRQVSVMQWKLNSLIWQGVTLAAATNRLFNRLIRHSLWAASPLWMILFAFIKTVWNPMKLP